MKIEIQIIQTAGSSAEPDGLWSAYDDMGNCIPHDIIKLAIEHKTRLALKDYNTPLGEVKMWGENGRQLDGSEKIGSYEVAF